MTNIILIGFIFYYASKGSISMPSNSSASSSPEIQRFNLTALSGLIELDI
jgi:formate hydrogenlyase subunit 3/multisubunit Na+/H+ antiporter MnhD subunit